jgi:hypothetical protein
LLTATGEPSTLAEALEEAHWCQAMDDEYQALMENKTYHLVSVNSTRIIINCMWVYRIKKMLMAL